VPTCELTTLTLDERLHDPGGIDSRGRAGHGEAVADVVDQSRIDEALAELDPGWSGTTDHLERDIEFADFLTAVQFIDEIAPVCEERDHHPDLTLSWRRLSIMLTTHSADGVTEADLALAAELDRIAADFPVAAD
jgi:4a-hydroxytetrahydrobiopterin dehydratase